MCKCVLSSASDGEYLNGSVCLCVCLSVGVPVMFSPQCEQCTSGSDYMRCSLQSGADLWSDLSADGLNKDTDNPADCCLLRPKSAAKFIFQGDVW